MQQFPWGHHRRFNDFSTHFRRIFDQRVQKISLNTGFTCPNRDGSRGRGGCSYCNNETFNPAYTDLASSVTEQLNRGMAFFSDKYPDMHYVAYFQSYTNTYAPLGYLQALYEEALAHPRIKGLVIATRPDCIDADILDYLVRLSEKTYVMVEYGVESHLDRTLERINRGHTFADSVGAITETARRGIHTCAHMILGLPGESYADFLNQARVISALPVENLKLHQLQIHKGTVMARQYFEDPQLFHLFSAEEYTDLVVDYLELLNPAIVVERFISQSPVELLIAPRWGLKNFEVVAKVEKRLKERNTWQGRRFEAPVV
jgi:uncharacterized protein